MKLDKSVYSNCIMRICFIVANYPTISEPVYPFVKELVDKIADAGYCCDVIAPQSLTNKILRHKKVRPKYWNYKTEKNQIVNVYQPLFLSFSNLKIRDKRLSPIFFINAAKKAFRKIEDEIDIMYGHFWDSGMVAALISKKKPIPLFVASGESTITIKKKYAQKNIVYLKSRCTGIICVSTKNLNESIKLGLVDQIPVTVIPNGIDNTKFYPRDKYAARKKLNIDQEIFIVAFVGAFINRKGVDRLSDAIKLCNNDVYSFFIGKGDIKPDCPGILHCGPLPLDSIAEYLSAADVFVLPTLAEGCSNAIVEAMACGLPIISSNLPFNDDILTDANSIRIDPNNVAEIAEAITLLQNKFNLRKEMSEASFNLSKTLDIETRTMKVIDFMLSCIEKQEEDK